MDKNETVPFSFGPVFTPTTAGGYHVQTETQLSADQTAENDNIETELVVIDTAGMSSVNLSFTDNSFGNLFGFEP